MREVSGIHLEILDNISNKILAHKSMAANKRKYSIDVYCIYHFTEYDMDIHKFDSMNITVDSPNL